MSTPSAHTLRVMRLYRAALKDSLSWIIIRDEWRKTIPALRQRFEANRNIPDRKLAERIVADGERELQEKSHPDPYIFPSALWGSKWERNIPPPDWCLQMTPEEQSWYDAATPGHGHDHGHASKAHH